MNCISALAQPNANPPERLTYQGFLADGSGVALATNAPKNYDVVFRIWDGQTGGTNAWTEQQTVTVDKGFFSVLLGEGAQVTSPATEPHGALSTLFTNATASDRYVEMTVKGIGAAGADVKILPRLRLLTAPYAYLATKAISANSVDGGAVTSGTVPDARFSTNVALLNRTPQAFAGVNTFAGNVGIGTTNPAAKLDVNGNVAISGNVGIGTALALGKVTAQTADFGFGFAHTAGTVQLATQIALGAGWFGTVTSHPLNFFVNNGNAGITLATSGNVGIGTSTPTQGRLVVSGTSGPDALGQSYALALSSSLIYNAGATPWSDCSIKASGVMHASAFRATSDARIKKVKGVSDAARDLDTLLGIGVTDFAYIDTVAHDSRPQKKVIAQQVEKVYPQAVKQTTDVVPDIYQKATLKDGWVQLATDLKVGDRVRLIGDKEEGIHKVLEVAADGFRTDFKPAGDKVFVYGREVDDFRTVDYEAISMLNVSATQELARRLEKLEARETHLADLEQKAGRVATLEQEVADLKKMVAQLAKASRVTEQAANTTTAARPVADALVQKTITTASLER